MPLGTKVGLGRGHIVLDGDPAPQYYIQTNIQTLECGPIPSEGTQTRSDSSVILFLIRCRKVWVTSTASTRVVTLPIYENAILGRKVHIAPDKIPLGSRDPENVYIVYQPRRRPNIVQSLVDLR